ncbi:hypothetical protein L1286_12770 [Pseudoalteromonas sp. SMS1]|uniref:hypothetical protein n=1 Tax=Pseudoalteromonas sp. SMS1 TaxID=2908894 RepID=UPI001F4155FE|nr:hypothetical protein [Pseudoalteromonas sp. SMS1]MCF2858353.1 hypothetical protein [Pseudoalteromonas sp. SMS1]
MTASIDLSNKKRAIIDINVPARHPLTDFSMGSPILEFYIRGRHLESGKTFCTALPNVLSQS